MCRSGKPERGEAPDLLRVAAGDGYLESPDGGRSWEPAARYPEPPSYLRGLALTAGEPD